jgi:hypothetical protein
MFEWRKQSVLNVYMLLLGALLFLSPWLFKFRYEPARIDSWATGLFLIAASVMVLMAYDDRKELVVIILGAWTLVSPWVLGYPTATAMKVHIGLGLVVAYLAGLELWLVHYEFPTEPIGQKASDAARSQEPLSPRSEFMRDAPPLTLRE